MEEVNLEEVDIVVSDLVVLTPGDPDPSAVRHRGPRHHLKREPERRACSVPRRTVRRVDRPKAVRVLEAVQGILSK